MSLLFWSLFARRYAKSPIADEAAYQKKLELTRGYFRPDMEILEFGCGTGSTAITHAPHVHHVRATDFSENMLKIGRRRADAQHVDNITFERSSIEELSVPDHSLDAVLGLSILHLLRSKEAAIAKVHNMLRPGGIFVSSTMCAAGTIKPWSLSALFLYLIVPIASLLRLLPPVQVFSAKELEKSLTDAGFLIDHQWCPGSGNSVFIVARKRAEDNAASKAVVCHSSS